MMRIGLDTLERKGSLREWLHTARILSRATGATRKSRKRGAKSQCAGGRGEMIIEYACVLQSTLIYLHILLLKEELFEVLRSAFLGDDL